MNCQAVSLCQVSYLCLHISRKQKRVHSLEHFSSRKNRVHDRTAYLFGQKLDQAFSSAPGGSGKWSYMKNMSEAEEQQTDLVLAPLLSSAEESDSEEAWQLPCHSVILSAHSAVFSASKRHSMEMQTEKTTEGKRVLRLPLTENAAEILLQYCYGVFGDVKDMTADEAFELATISNMQAMRGNTHDCVFEASSRFGCWDNAHNSQYCHM